MSFVQPTVSVHKRYKIISIVIRQLSQLTEESIVRFRQHLKQVFMKSYHRVTTAGVRWVTLCTTALSQYPLFYTLQNRFQSHQPISSRGFSILSMNELIIHTCIYHVLYLEKEVNLDLFRM